MPTDNNMGLSDQEQTVQQQKLAGSRKFRQDDYFQKKPSAVNYVDFTSSNQIQLGNTINDESNDMSDTNIETDHYSYKNSDIDIENIINPIISLLRRRINRRQNARALQSRAGCSSHDILVEYIYEHDVHNQIFNSSLQKMASTTVQRLQSEIIDWTVEEIYKRNLAADVIDHVRLVRMVDVSKEYNNNPTVRYYVSLVVRKTLIPVIRRILALVFEKLQRKYFLLRSNKINGSNMVTISI